jgi:abequosyltransferase
MNKPIISVCIPAYNRAGVLSELLDSITEQDFDSFEIVITEDCSPQRSQISEVMREYKERYPNLIRYFENEENLGYDGNLRHLFEVAQGDYLFFMGNDDQMCPGALVKVADAIARYPDVGVVLRSYAAFDGVPDNIVQIFRYFDDERFFPAGIETITTLYRRSVVIPGMVFHRQSALKYSTDRFDGTLLYQLYLVAQILAERNAVFLPDITVLYRNGGTPDFGNSAAEQGKFEPQNQTPESSLLFIKGMLGIAREIAKERRLPFYRPVFRDLANYSYPLLSIQARQPKSIFFGYGWSLVRMGFGRYPLFWVYWLSILMLGTNRMDRMIVWIKKKLGYTPSLGKVYQGTSG